MPLNTCKIIIKNDNQSTISKGILCTNDVELHVLMLTCPRQPKIRRNSRYEKNNRKPRSMHGLRTMRSLLHRSTFKIKRHSQSLQQRKTKTHQQNQTRSKQTRLLRHPMSPLRRRTMRNRLPIRCHAKRPKNRRSHSQQRKMHRLLDLRHGLSIRCINHG